jgi:hypothetical protein
MRITSSHESTASRGSGHGTADDEAGTFNAGLDTTSNQAKSGKTGQESSRAGTKRKADEAGLPEASGEVKTPRTSTGKEGTYAGREAEKTRLGIQTNSKTHQSEHVIGYSSAQDVKRDSAAGRQLEGPMPAYHETLGMHADHAGTGTWGTGTNSSKSDKTKERAERTGFTSSQQYREHQRAALTDPTARADGANASNALQLNQLGYAHQYRAQERVSGQPHTPDPKANDSYANMVVHDPAWTHSLNGGQTTEHLGPHGQAEALLARETATSGNWPTQERIDEALKRFGTRR